MTHTWRVVMIVFLGAAIVCPVQAQMGLKNGVFATGGALMSDGTYAAAGTIGQGVIGGSTGSTYTSYAGFWGGGGVILDVKGPTAPGRPMVYALEQNYPNPFNPATIIRYDLPKRSHVTLAVYNTVGQQVATLVQGQQEAGSYEVKFDGTGLASGVYFYRLQAGTYVDTRRLLLLR